MRSRYLSGHSRAERALSPPIRRHGKHSLSPSARHHLVDRSPPPYCFAAKEPVHSQPFTDAHCARSSLGLSPDSWREGLGGKDYETTRYEADRYTDGYSNHSSYNKIGLNERSSYWDSAFTKFQWKHLLDEKQPAGDVELSHRTSISERVSQEREVSETDMALKPTSMTDSDSVRNRNFPAYLGPGLVSRDRYGYCDGNSVAGLGFGGDGTWNYDKFSAREPSREEERLKFDYLDGLPNAASTGQIHAPVYPYGSTDSFSGYLKRTSHDEYGQMPPVRSGYNELLDSSPVVRSQMENVGREFAYSRECCDFGSLPDKLYYKNLASVREGYGLQGTFKTSPQVNLADRTEGVEDSGGECSRGSRLLYDQHRVSGVSYMGVQDEVYEAGATHLEQSREEYLDYEPSNMIEDDGFGQGHGSWPYGDRFNSISSSECGEGFLDADWKSRHRLTEEELNSVSPSKRIVKPKREFDKRRLGYNFSASDLSHGDEGCINKNANCFYGSFKHGRFLSTYNSHSKKRRAIPEDYLFSNDISMTIKRSSRKPMVPAVRDIKKRLGPPPGNVRRPCPWVKKTLSGQANLTDHVSNGSGGEFLETMTDGFESNANINLDAAKVEPHEDSEEFTQLVNGAFLKFVKLLNENMAQRRKYTDQGRSGILKCTVCGRSVIAYVVFLEQTSSF